VPDYPKLAQLWWPNVADALAGVVSPQQAMDNLARQQDEVLGRLERSGIQGACGPTLGAEESPQLWFDRPGAPKPKVANEKPKGTTVPYEALIAAWREGRAR
jgi:glycerol transport system substrate-binding protein